ncbi:MAG: helix-turn-helix transcriptional regulator [Clostridia bacterium]|nr:helix-turn-helix transcriptional regulator [Clostridia bacterium]
MFFEIDKNALEVLPIALHTVGETLKEDKISRPGGLGFHEIIWIRRGEGIFNVEGESFVLSEGQGVFMRGDVGHEYHGDGFTTGWCTFSFPDEALDYLGVPRVMRFDVPSFLDAETDALHDFAFGDSTILTRSSAVYSYIVDFFSAVLGEKESLSVKISHILDSRYGEPLTLDIIASELGIDKFSLCRAFMREKGTSIMEELKRIRIAKAKRFLRFSSESIENIGKMCGFESASYFAKRFKEISGISPTEYRRNI